MTTHENGVPVTPDWVPQSREAPEFIEPELKMPAVWTGDQA